MELNSAQFDCIVCVEKKIEKGRERMRGSMMMMM